MKLPFYLKDPVLAKVYDYRLDDKPFSKRITNKKFNKILRDHKSQFYSTFDRKLPNCMSSKGAVATEATNNKYPSINWLKKHCAETEKHYKAIDQVKQILNSSYKVRVISGATSNSFLKPVSHHLLEKFDDMLSELLFSIDDRYTIDFATDIV